MVRRGSFGLMVKGGFLVCTLLWRRKAAGRDSGLVVPGRQGCRVEGVESRVWGVRVRPKLGDADVRRVAGGCWGLRPPPPCSRWLAWPSCRSHPGLLPALSTASLLTAPCYSLRPLLGLDSLSVASYHSPRPLLRPRRAVSCIPLLTKTTGRAPTGCRLHSTIHLHHCWGSDGL